MLLGLRLRRGEELGDDLDREDAVDPALVVDHRRVLRLALEQVGERVAHDVVAVEQRPERRVGSARHRLGGEVALGEPAERAALAVDQQRVGDLDVGRGQLRPHLGGRLADVGQRRLPEVDVGDPHQRQPLQRPVGADEVLDELVGGVHQQLGRGRVLGDLAALAHDRDPVAHLDRLVDVVGDEEDGLARSPPAGGGTRSAGARG